MELEKQVCSLELAKRLKELGAKQDAFFMWYGDGTLWADGNVYQSTKVASAFTVAELGEMLPSIAEGHPFQTYRNTDFQWFFCYGSEIEFGPEPTEADARAKMLIYLIEQGLVKP